MKAKNIEKSRVLQTNEYGLFTYEKERVFRRKIDMLKVVMTEKNISKDVPIIVNDEYKILDGRHRFIANVELKQPIYYKIAETANFLDLLKATTLVRKPTTYDFLLAHKDKLFYRKFIEFVKLLPYPCEDVLTVITGISLHHSSVEYRKFQNGESEFKKEYEYKCGQIDELVNYLHDSHNYFENEISDVDSILDCNKYSAAVAIDNIKSIQGISNFFSLSENGHPALPSLKDYMDEVYIFETEGYDVHETETDERFYGGHIHRRTSERFPTLSMINKIFKVKYSVLSKQ